MFLYSKIYFIKFDMDVHLTIMKHFADTAGSYLICSIFDFYYQNSR